jgi:nucleoside-diphosphate-sugar epimerase
MKVIVTGASGRIGCSALRHCLASPKVTSVVVLARRALPFESTLPSDQKAKLRTLILKPNDFLTYPAHVLDALKGAEACIWALGIPIGQSAKSTWEVEVDYPTTAAKTFKEHLTVEEGKTFRFVLISADAISEETATKSMWFKADFLKSKVSLLCFRRPHFLIFYHSI